jgi:hypothetical protein
MSWYALMILQDKERDLEKSLSYIDYHAAFSNYEGVMKAKQMRESQKEDSIKEAEEFIESARNNEFKNNPLIDAIKRLREANSNISSDDSALRSINLNKLIKEDI